MNRNTELHYGHVPKIHQQRSKFDLSHTLRTSFDAANIVPLFCDADILPGDTVQVDMAEIVRMATPIYPIMDNMWMDIYWFFTPHRLVMDHWAEFWGENDDPWTQQTEYEIPTLEAPSGGWARGTIADYFGIPTYIDDIKVNALPFRAYAKVYSDWFRDENLKAACHVYTDETDRTGSNGTTYVTDCELGGMPAKAAKMHDRFTSCLPTPQKGPSVAIPLGTTAGIFTGTTDYQLGQGASGQPLHWTYANGQGLPGTAMSPSISTNGLQTNADTYSGGTSIYNIVPSNLYADLTNATAATISELRTAFAIQKYYEAAGRNGTRYIEYLRAVFGVESSDARVQRSEYLGGKRIPININQILQTSSTDNTSPQGHAAGFSCTLDRDSYFTKSFEEHGTLLCLGVVRYEHSYQQGIPKQFMRRKWTDFYNPYFAHLSEQPILNKEIYAQGDSVVDTDGKIIDDQVFGYQEAWGEYRFKENRASGDMRSNSPAGSLDSWILTDDYSALPTLGSTWIDEDEQNINRVIAVSSALAHQFWGSFAFDMKYTRCMPVYSVPGLIDHV